MSKPDSSTEVITIRVSRALTRRLDREARRQRRTRSAVARAILAAGLGEQPGDPFAEARRQSLLVRRRASEREAIRFIVDFADLEGWE
ncbi:MAG TPA: ribbon-helix-helix protein, CopG family [Vicinamibacterales bacterium]|nr:ribbon-helix-helix protein, CopG family [Vicinamibacterales bacterium]